MKTISLSGMDRDGLHQLMFAAQQVNRAMIELEQFGGLVTVSMVPGEPVRIECDNPISGLFFRKEEPTVVSGVVAPIQVVIPAGIEPETPAFETPAAPVFSPGEDAGTSGGGEASAAAGEDPETGIAPAAPAESAEPVDPGGAGDSAAGAPQKVEDEEEARGGRPPRWTDEETETALAILVPAVLEGRRPHSVAQAIADATGRPVPSIQQRIKDTWRDEVARRVAAAVEAAVEEVPVAPTVTETPKAAPEGEVVVDPLGAHLAKHIGAGGWTLAQDAELFRLAEAGWPSHEIALELRKPAADVSRRFDLLTDKRFAKHRRADVLARLEAFTAKAV